MKRIYRIYRAIISARGIEWPPYRPWHHYHEL